MEVCGKGGGEGLGRDLMAGEDHTGLSTRTHIRYPPAITLRFSSLNLMARNLFHVDITRSIANHNFFIFFSFLLTYNHTITLLLSLFPLPLLRRRGVTLLL